MGIYFKIPSKKQTYYRCNCHWKATVFQELHQVLFIYFLSFVNIWKSINDLLYKGVIESGLYFVSEAKKKIKLFSWPFLFGAPIMLANVPEKGSVFREA